ncbi:hypothetical protein E6C60_2214 [Paenibacillus algicola]|uniref:Uncharacterized protein n=1 Tax=Paenibacillus algicola TaxID=2565926 RepID=A0A4P8XJU4_9BACL|nr:hypothetical protein E6C60_2214 [Paenibacillus algicola]
MLKKPSGTVQNVLIRWKVFLSYSGLATMKDYICLQSLLHRNSNLDVSI